MKKELLAPVGNKESLYQAVQNGADAVYLAGKNFGARAFANNFTNEEMVQAIKYCHLYNVKIYVTVNTMLYEREIKECINYIRFLHQNNVDAVIIQDIGLLTIIREKFPNLEVHASTQMHNHNIEQLKKLEELGVKRVVLARELSLPEINKLKINMEIEAFIHGALCISYSGQCLFSSLLMDRSGNKGSCAGICRLPFNLVEDNQKQELDGEYLLSPKEFSTMNNFLKIMESNIYSLKIEGRMKSPYYVGFITRLYRQLIDNYYHKKSLEISIEDQKKLAVLYNREFTKGHLFLENNNDLMNIKSPNHQGIEIGDVLEITKQKIKIKLSDDLNQEDGIRFANENKGMIVNFLYDENNLLINEAKKDDLIFVDNKLGITKKGKVLKTIDHKLEKELSILPEKKIDVTCAVIAKIGKELLIAFSDGQNKIMKHGKIVEVASKIPTTKDIIEEKLSGFGNSPFKLKKIEIISDDNIFLRMSELKKLRRSILEELKELRENKVVHEFVEKDLKDNKMLLKENKDESINLNVLVRTKEQLITCLEEKVSCIYVEDETLYKEFKHHKNIYLKLERVKNNFPPLIYENILAEETGSLFKYAHINNVVTDYYFNVANSYSFKFLENMKASRITISIEAKLEDVSKMVKNISSKEKIELYLYGRPEVMLTKYCPLKLLTKKDEPCTICKSNHQYYLQDRNNKLYPIVNELKSNHLTHIYFYKPLDRIKDLEEYLNMGIRNYRLEFFDEDPDTIKNIIRKVNSVKF